MRSNSVPGFLPSRQGFRFANRWPSGPAREWHFGLVHLGIGDVGRGLCGGMAFAAADRFARGEDGAPDEVPPAFGSPLFTEVVDRQFDSFGRLFVVPLRFWLASAGSQAGRDRKTVRDAWPTIKAAIDGGELPMVGLVRLAGRSPFVIGLGHQVIAFRYDESATKVEIGIYDPNHPGRDDVALTLERDPSGSYAMRQSTGEPLICLLALPFRPA